MKNLSNDFVTVDMRGLKASLVERALSEQVSASVIVRRAVARELRTDVPNLPKPRGFPGPKSTKVSIRLAASEAQVLAARAKADGVSMGTLIAGFTAEVPALRSSGTPVDVLAALVASSA